MKKWGRQADTHLMYQYKIDLKWVHAVAKLSTAPLWSLYFHYYNYMLTLYIRLCRYFHGSHHLEEIMLIENMSRSQLLTLIDKFGEVLVTCTLPEHSAALSSSSQWFFCPSNLIYSCYAIQLTEPESVKLYNLVYLVFILVQCVTDCKLMVVIKSA